MLILNKLKNIILFKGVLLRIKTLLKNYKLYTKSQKMFANAQIYISIIYNKFYLNIEYTIS